MFVLSADAQILHSELTTVQHGNTVTYETLSKRIGRDVQKEARGVLTTARRITQREDSIVFEAVRAVGLRRLTGNDFAELGKSTVKRLGKGARRLRTKLKVADISRMDDQGRISMAASAAIANAFEHASKQSTVKRLEAAATSEPMSLDTTLKLFKN